MLCRKAFFAALAVLLLLPSLALAFGEVRQADRDLNVRKDRSLNSAHVKTLKKGELVRTDYLKDGWVAVFDVNDTVRDESRALGFSNVKYLKRVKDPVAAPKADKAQKTATITAPRAEKPAVQTAQAPAAKSTVPVQAAAKSAADAVVTTKPATSTKPAAMPRQAAVPSTPPAPDKAEVKGKVAPAPTQAEDKGAQSQGAPVKITSDRMVYDDAKGTVSFEGNVHAVHSSLSLWAKEVTAYFVKKGEGGDPAENVDRILATGGVRMRYQDRVTGNCDRILYTVKSGILRMQGNPVLEDGPNKIQGEEIRFYLKDNRSEVVGGKGKRVEATFITPEDMQSP